MLLCDMLWVGTERDGPEKPSLPVNSPEKIGRLDGASTQMRHQITMRQGA